MTPNSKIVAALIAAVVLIGAALALFGVNETLPNTFGGGITGGPSQVQATTSTTVAVTTSTRVLASTSPYTRAYASICNAGTKTVALRMDSDKLANAINAGGILLAAGACFEITDRMQYLGSVQASSSDQSSVPVLVSDYVY